MQQGLFDIIKQLSTTDEKTLTQKTLKLGEEFGELAKKVLPYENGFATTHRFVTQENILEEVADVLLCAYSIAYDLGFDNDDIEEKMKEKTFKWNKLQQNSIKGKFPLPFEIHVTVRLPNSEWVQEFKDACAMIGVKPIVLDLGHSAQDVMTSSVIITDNKGAYDEMRRISQLLSHHEFNVVREKIETVPWHPAVPQSRFDEIVTDRYFESHINIVVSQEERNKLMDWVETSGANIQGHFSNNIFKKLNETDLVQMLTLRSSTISGIWIDNAEDFTNYVNRVIEVLNDVSFLRKNAVLKHVIEYAIYDTNVSHDTTWINGE
ncbi:MAG: hypothetical protein EO766_11940 [Hydrotalea sp. AMD]|uniref:MazG-like family protein n=1 Tax=Hydrotalea sp. AMD TaxID=2501297 RepID=UPI00102790FA|nr:MazG-like family protein [Hydrotalea sp. AMD]RWZ87230.1 MAG: hypothetical protein EO766_11940 [Hydrotalea sp. AMD]